MRLERGLAHRLDWPLLVLALCLLAIGFLNLGSATQAQGEQWLSAPLRRQLVSLGVGLVALVAVLVVDYRHLERFAPLLYLFGLGLLAATSIYGHEARGNRSWLVFGSLRLQPSEFTKLALVAMLARYFYRHPLHRLNRLHLLVIPGVLIALPVSLIVLQRDLGVALLTLLIGCTYLPLARIRGRAWLAVALLAGISCAAGWHYALAPYQKDRILNVVQPERDPLASGYQSNQSRIAVGSGGLLGKGYRAGTQSQLRFLPTQHTDFAFSVWAEEWGLVGSATALSLYAALLLYGLVVARGAREDFGTLLATGLVGALFWPAVINIAMVLGLAPVIGVPLPFFSYGGSALVSALIALGLLLNISMRRYMF